MWITGPQIPNFCFGGWGVASSIWVSEEFPGEANAAAPGTTLGELER